MLVTSRDRGSHFKHIHRKPAFLKESFMNAEYQVKLKATYREPSVKIPAKHIESMKTFTTDRYRHS